MNYALLPAICLLLCPLPGRSCVCEISHSACKEVGASDLVFIGTVETIEPNFLNRWNTASPAVLRLLNDAYIEAQEKPSAASLTRLKQTYLKAFPELPEDRRAKLQASKSIDEVAGLFYSALDRGKRIRFHIKTAFKLGDDDDDKAESVEIWTPFGDCGFDFQTGETYLVYANSDEDSDYIFTGSCTRTRRLSDAGEDLAYLFFLKDNPKESARLEGFATSDGRSQLDREPLHDKQTIDLPVADLIIALQSPRLKRYAQSDANGRFLFDGLPEGDYTVSAFAPGYPVNTVILAGPQSFHIEEKSCTRQVLVVQKTP